MDATAAAASLGESKTTTTNTTKLASSVALNVQRQNFSMVQGLVNLSFVIGFDRCCRGFPRNVLTKHCTASTLQGRLTLAALHVTDCFALPTK